jgi:hypothetical protein
MSKVDPPATASVCGQLDVPGVSGLAVSAQQRIGTGIDEVAAQADDAAASPAPLAELPEAPLAAGRHVASKEQDTTVPAGEAASAAAGAAELDTEGGVQEQQQQPGKKAANVLGQQAGQLILADLAGWFAEGQEQQRQQQLEALAASVREQQQGSSSTGSKKRSREGVSAAALGVRGRLSSSSLPAAGDVRCDAKQLQMSGMLRELDEAGAAAGAQSSSKRTKLASGVFMKSSESLTAAVGVGLDVSGAYAGSAVRQCTPLVAPAVLPGFLCALEFLGVNV